MEQGFRAQDSQGKVEPPSKGARPGLQSSKYNQLSYYYTCRSKEVHAQTRFKIESDTQITIILYGIRSDSN